MIINLSICTYIWGFDETYSSGPLILSLFSGCIFYDVKCDEKYCCMKFIEL